MFTDIIRTLSCILLLCCLCDAFAEEYNPAEAEDSLLRLFNQLADADSPDKQTEINQEIIDILSATLKSRTSFDYPFDSLSLLGKIHSQDSCLRVYTWNYSESPDRHRYFGFLQLRDPDNDDLSVYFLNQKEITRDDFGESTFTNENWYGALYYQVYAVFHDDKTYYTLIGFDFNDIFTNIKIVDVLTFVDDIPIFGAPVFHYSDRILNRSIFEYSSRVVMFLRYIPELRMIVYDHLSPSMPRLIGQYRHYGPDFSYDALRFENGRWVHFPDIDWKQ